jgi:hypothetical protein
LSHLFLNEYSEHPFTELVGSHSIDDRIKHWWNDNIQIGQKDMDVLGDISAKMMCYKEKESPGVIGQNDTEMGTTGAERF